MLTSFSLDRSVFNRESTLKSQVSGFNLEIPHFKPEIPSFNLENSGVAELEYEIEKFQI